MATLKVSRRAHLRFYTAPRTLTRAAPQAFDHLLHDIVRGKRISQSKMDQISEMTMQLVQVLLFSLSCLDFVPNSHSLHRTIQTSSLDCTRHIWLPKTLLKKSIVSMYSTILRERREVPQRRTASQSRNSHQINLATLVPYSSRCKAYLTA